MQVINFSFISLSYHVSYTVFNKFRVEPTLLPKKRRRGANKPQKAAKTAKTTETKENPPKSRTTRSTSKKVDARASLTRTKKKTTEIVVEEEQEKVVEEDKEDDGEPPMKKAKVNRVCPKTS